MYGSASLKLPGQHQHVESWCDDRRKASKRAVGLNKRQGTERSGASLVKNGGEVGGVKKPFGRNSLN